MTSYELSRNFWDFSFENTGKIKPVHVAIYFFAIEHCNRLGWKKNFGLPTSMVLEAISVKSYSVYKSSFDDLVDFGFFEVIQYSKNQYSSNIIALKENCKANLKANTKALDKAISKHCSKHQSKQCESMVSIDKLNNLITLEPNNSEIEISQPKFNFRKSLIDLGVSETIISDWLIVRKSKKAVNTKTSFDAIKNQIEISGLSANECIKIASENNWSGFKAIWVENLNKSNGQTFNTNSKGKLAGNIKAAEQLSREIEEKSRNFVSPMYQSG